MGPANEVKRCHLNYFSNDDRLTKLSAAQLYSSIHLYSGDFKLIYGQA